jgi:hypothetical protein
MSGNPPQNMITNTLTNASNLGGPFTGYSAKQTMTNFKDSEQSSTRTLLRRAWNNTNATSSNRVITPFRAVNNLGDLLGRQNYVCGGPNQVNASKPGWKGRIGSIISQCDNTGIDAAVCNTRFVPDSSDYIKFKKQQAMVRNYNDLGNGGDNSNGSFVALMGVRR